MERLAKEDDKIGLSLSLIENLAHRARLDPGPAGGLFLSFLFLAGSRTPRVGRRVDRTLTAPFFYAIRPSGPTLCFFSYSSSSRPLRLRHQACCFQLDSCSRSRFVVFLFLLALSSLRCRSRLAFDRHAGGRAFLGNQAPAGGGSRDFQRGPAEREATPSDIVGSHGRHRTRPRRRYACHPRFHRSGWREDGPGAGQATGGARARGGCSPG